MIAPPRRAALSLFIGLTPVTGLSYADPVQTDYVTFFEKGRYEDRLYFRLLADDGRCVVMLSIKNRPGAVESKLVTDLTAPCRFVRVGNSIRIVNYPKRGNVVLIAGAPASREYVENRWNAPPYPRGISFLDQCSTESQALIVKAPKHYFLSKRDGESRICPWLGPDEKFYYDFAHDRIR